MFAQMAQETLEAGDSGVLPDDLPIQRVSREKFAEYRSTLSGLTTENAD
jgi:hypothetical protein